MQYRLVEIVPRDLDPSRSEEKDTVTLGFAIKPPLQRVDDPEFVQKAADRMHPRGGFYNATFSHSDDEATYGTFETFGTSEEHMLRRKREIANDAQLVFGMALGTMVHVEFTAQPELTE